MAPASNFIKSSQAQLVLFLHSSPAIRQPLAFSRKLLCLIQLKRKKGGVEGSELTTLANWEPHLTQAFALMSDSSPDVMLWADERV